ncbi:Zinc finger, C2H2-like [Phytophthora cactorum]|nr:Zinc finger, C2H2-like [Phytophthora cactorum]
MDMAPLALSAKVDALSLGGHESLRSAQFLPPVTKTAANSMPTTPNEPKPVENKNDKKKIFRCTFPGCGREFQLKGNLKRHVNIHNGDKKFACKFCGKKFLRKADMEVHYRVHTGEKPYRCKYEECGKCFARRSDLLSHERTHTGRKPFACAFPGCDRSFARKFDLHKHQRLHEDQTDASGKPKTKKRKLSPAVTTPVAKRIDSGDESCDCPSDVANPLAPLPITTSCMTSRRKMSATAACLDTPTRPIRYELKCPENHIHSPPACLAALSSLDAFLMSQETLPFSLDAPPGAETPPPDDTTVSTGAKISSGSDTLDQLLTPFPSTTAPANNMLPTQKEGLTSNPSVLASMTTTSDLLTNSTLPQSIGNTFPEPSLAFIVPDVSGPGSLLSSSGTAPSALAQANSLASVAHGNYGPASTTIDLNTAPTAPAKACLSTPTSSLLDYSRHNRSCGHLSIQHGNHRDYVVQNHLSAKCKSPRDTHRPGCGHLPVRHKDHIDYVVEDNLICQQASWLEDDNLELLGDDFWDFYGAIDAFPTK